MSETPLQLTHGVSASLEATVVGGVSRWGDNYVLRGKIRTRYGRGSVLMDLAPHLSATVIGDDLKVSLHLTGSDVRTLRYGGVYDIFVSEAPDDAFVETYGDYTSGYAGLSEVATYGGYESGFSIPEFEPVDPEDNSMRVAYGDVLVEKVATP